ncbi:MAG: hypothetical protein E6G92_02345 [Alphaproteobacteria bacterium]|nr:MAG: hypothetical protein E6G92_02345 [Alphaproteobacteria bacterium]
MATLVLTAVGTAIGGPIGGAIGSIAGQILDREVLFAPKPIHGARLGDLAVQISSYGAAIPKIFGTMRVAGTVIWSTDLIERRTSSGGGKGRPKTIGYSYSASFAVALSARPILGIGRIWADGKLLRGAAGDFKSATGFRIHSGGEDQPADPLIAAAEGIAQTPGFRGIAYALFEDFQLEDYGNRIPSLTFEVIADAGAVSVGAMAEALGGGMVVAGETPVVGGYAVSEDSVRGAIAALAEVAPLSLVDDGERLTLTAGAGEADALGASDEQGRREIVRRGASTLPREASVAYYEIERDYQAGLQRATRGGASGPADRSALPAALGAAEAKRLAEERLAAAWAGRLTARVTRSWRACALSPGGHVLLEGEAGRWRIERMSIGPMTVTLDLVRIAPAGFGAPPASPGVPVRQPDMVHGPTVLRLLDLPLGDGTAGAPLLFAAAAGSEAGWRRAAIEASFDGGGTWLAAGSTAAPAVIGTVLGALAPAGPALADRESAIEVELLNASMWLESRSDDALANGENLALVGEELIQFGAADPVGTNRFRLSRLWRGRRGTEWAAALHSAGEGFVLIEAESLVPLQAPAGSAGGEARLIAYGIGDPPEGAAAERPIAGEAIRPPSPVHLTAEPLDGGVTLRWVRRSRQGWVWPSGGDTPLGEEAERYRVKLAGEGFSRSAIVTEPSFHYGAAERAADGGGPALVSIVQLGTFAVSRPATLLVS